MKVKLDENAFLPTRAYDDDAGLDLRSPMDRKLPAHKSIVIDTGVHVELPARTFGKIESKSGLMVNHNIVSPGGVVDESYRGSIVVKLENHGDKDYWIQAGDKIAQLIIQPYLNVPVVEVCTLDDTDRGFNGFGSTGR